MFTTQLRAVKGMLDTMLDYIKEMYLAKTDKYTGYNLEMYEFNWSMKKWAAKEWYEHLIDSNPQCVTDVYLASEYFIRKIVRAQNLSKPDNRYQFSIAYDTAMDLHDHLLTADRARKAYGGKI